jgi:hypothetical protein
MWASNANRDQLLRPRCHAKMLGLTGMFKDLDEDRRTVRSSARPVLNGTSTSYCHDGHTTRAKPRWQTDQILGSYQLALRNRSCPTSTTCGAWSAVDLGTGLAFALEGKLTESCAQMHDTRATIWGNEYEVALLVRY